MNKDFSHRLRALVRQGDHAIRAELPKVDINERVAVIRLYDPVDSWGGEWGMSAKELAAVLDDIPAGQVDEIRLHINSPGGDVFDGIAIVNTLRAHDARIVAVVDGIAASAASFIAASADEVIMSRNSELMIHDAWGMCVGNASDMAAMAEMLAHVSDNIASIYAEKAGGTIADWRAAMTTETWYSADEAVEAGLADSVDAKPADDKAKARFDLSIFTYAGRDHAPAPVAPLAAPEPPVAPAAEPLATSDSGKRYRHLVATTRR